MAFFWLAKCVTYPSKQSDISIVSMRWWCGWFRQSFVMCLSGSVMVASVSLRWHSCTIFPQNGISHIVFFYRFKADHYNEHVKKKTLLTFHPCFFPVSTMSLTWLEHPDVSSPDSVWHFISVSPLLLWLLSVWDQSFLLRRWNQTTWRFLVPCGISGGVG